MDFPDLVGVNLTDIGCVNLINSLNAFYSEMSYGRASFTSNTLTGRSPDPPSRPRILAT